jgi:nucleotide-binding universal stress UspA family protein
MYRTILVPLDGSPTAEAILPHAVAIATSGSGEVVLLTVIDPKPVQDPRLLAGIEDQTRAYLAGIRATWSIGASPKWRTLVQVGSPADAILQTAQRESASLIAMTTHGRTGLKRLIMGSVTEKILQSCQVPVLILPSK